MRSRQLMAYALLGFGLAACSKGFETSAIGTTTTAESAYCGTSKTISGSTSTVTGAARFKFRKLVDSGTDWYLDYTFSNAEVPFAEFHVLDEAGNIIQCGETDTNGNFSFDIPDTGTFTLQVLSRAYNDNYKVSVLKDVYRNEPYAITKTFIAGGSVNLGNLMAEADETVDGDIPGGAFNIMYDILMANEYLSDNSGMTGFTGAPKVTVYWKAGFNPYSYFGAPDSPLSFYRSGVHELYILGGLDGDVATSDTDHFDDSVIMHEYGHFLEDIYGKTNTPGGSHNGDAIIDPRLAWSEGWANYFQAQVKSSVTFPTASSSLYIDTYGHKTDAADVSGFGQNVLFDMKEIPGVGVYDNPTYAQEGVFREVSISRTLFKTVYSGNYSSSPTRAGGSIPFEYIWSAFGDGDSTGSPTIDGFHSDNVHFRNFGLFNSILDSILTRHAVSETNWNTILTEESQTSQTNAYGGMVTVGGSCPQTMTPVINSSSGLRAYCVLRSGSSCLSYAYNSNQLRSNDFFGYCYDGVHNPTISLSYSQTDPSKVGLDLFVFKEDYTYLEYVRQLFGETNSSLVAQNTTPISDGDTKSVSLSGQPAGCYMINVRARTTNPDGTDMVSPDLSSTITYDLSADGGSLCP